MIERYWNIKIKKEGTAIRFSDIYKLHTISNYNFKASFNLKRILSQKPSGKLTTSFLEFMKVLRDRENWTVSSKLLSK